MVPPVLAGEPCVNVTFDSRSAAARFANLAGVLFQGAHERGQVAGHGWWRAVLITDDTTLQPSRPNEWASRKSLELALGAGEGQRKDHIEKW